MRCISERDMVHIAWKGFAGVVDEELWTTVWCGVLFQETLFLNIHI
jgi:hypothetical protein